MWSCKKESGSVLFSSQSLQIFQSSHKAYFASLFSSILFRIRSVAVNFLLILLDSIDYHSYFLTRFCSFFIWALGSLGPLTHSSVLMLTCLCRCWVIPQWWAVQPSTWTFLVEPMICSNIRLELHVSGTDTAECDGSLPGCMTLDPGQSIATIRNFCIAKQPSNWKWTCRQCYTWNLSQILTANWMGLLRRYQHVAVALLVFARKNVRKTCKNL